jgi:hypothetical protein
MNDILPYIAYFNNSKILSGCCMILMNLGGRFIVGDLGIIHNKILATELFKKLVIFAIFFIATRDILTAFMLTISYILIIDGLLHEKRKFCIVPKEFIPESPQVTEQDYNKAKDIIKSYEAQATKQTKTLKDNINIFDIYKNNLLLLNQNATS